QGYLATPIEQRIAGVVVPVTPEQESDLAPLLAAGIPTIAVDRRAHDFPGDTSLLDHLRAARMAAQHPHVPGHRRLVRLAGPSGVSTTEDGLRGALDALDKAGIPHDDRRMLRSDLEAAEAEAMVRELLAGDRRPDAIFATNGPV